MKATVTSLQREVSTRLPQEIDARPIVPHRAYRTARMPVSGIVASVIAVAAIEVALAFYWSVVARFIVQNDTTIVGRVVAGTSVIPHSFLGRNVGAMLFGMRTHSVPELFTWIAVCALVISVVTALRGLTKPLQYFINVNAWIIGLEAVFLLVVGHLGYSADAFSKLLLDTMIVAWFVMPVFIGFVAVLFPFKAWESFTLIVAASAYVVLLEAVRYAVFPAILTRTGPILMSDLYLLYGPLLDIIPVVGIFGIMLTRLSSRLKRTPEAWRWL